MDLDAFIPVLLIVIAVMGVALVSMSVGVMFGRPCLRGSCGGSTAQGADEKAIACANCPNRR